jgi:hypothetical protein
MTSGLKELFEEARCLSLKQACSGWHMSQRDTNIIEDPGEVQIESSHGRAEEQDQRKGD